MAPFFWGCTSAPRTVAGAAAAFFVLDFGAAAAAGFAAAGAALFAAFLTCVDRR